MSEGSYPSVIKDVYVELEDIAERLKQLAMELMEEDCQ